MAVAWFADPGDLPGRDVQCGEQRGGAVADVIMGVALGHPDLHRQHRRSAIQSLDLGLLIEMGLITANGGFLTKHSFGVYSATPPRHEFRWEEVQPAVDAEPTCVGEVDWSGVGIVESWTTPFTRDGEAEKAFLAVRTPTGTRALAVITDADEAVASTREDIAGAGVTVHSDGTANLL